MLICIELSELIICCKCALKFLLFEVIYYIFLYCNFLPIHSCLTYKRHMGDTPCLKNLVMLSTYQHAI